MDARFDEMLRAFTGGGKRYVDLSAQIEQTPPHLPEWQRTELVTESHESGARDMLARFGIPSRLLRHGEGPATEHFTRFGTHNSTHVDAPWHYNSEIGGRRARTIDQLPLDWFVGAGVVLDMTHKADNDAVRTDEIEAELERIGHLLSPGEIVLVRTARDRYYGMDDYPFRGPGVSPEATVWLCERGVRVMGIDAWGWEPPLANQAAQAIARDEPGVFLAAHQIGREYSQIERLVNLAELPADGFLVICLPLRIIGASAGPTRAVAIVPEKDSA